jgi:hypothetical protein
MLSALLLSLLCLALRRLLAARYAIDGPAIFQGATRWQTYVALARWWRSDCGGQFDAASHMVCTTAARLLRPCKTTVSQIELLR